MSANVIRQDIIEVILDSNIKELLKITKELDELQKKLKGGVGGDAFDDLKENAEKSVKPLRNVKEEAEKVKQKVTEIGKKAAVTAFNGLKKLASISFKALIGGLTTAATAVAGLVAKSVSEYAEYEQLYGGMQTLLGAKGATNVEEYAKIVGKPVGEVTKEYKKLADSEQLVMKNANDAFRTAGMSANQYMETVTSFSASLTSSLGGDTLEAAKLADTAIKDMADNANKMGTPLENVSTVYSNLARGMYMTLDNLKLGYAGTKEGAKQLVNDAAKIDKSVKANDLSYANLVKAIHAVQVKMDIYGTTGKEANKTITGSLNTFKAAWSNLMPAMIQGGDQFDQCIKNLIGSIVGFENEAGELEGGIIANLMPAIEKSLGGIGTLIEKLAPILEREFPKIVEQLLPPLIKAATALLKGLIKALPSIAKTIINEIPFILSEVGKGIKEAFGVDFKIDAFESLGNFLKKHSGTIEKAIPILIGLAGALLLFSKLKSIGSGLSGIMGLFGGKKDSGGGSGGLMNTIKSFAKAKPTVILKGMANLAIVLAGFTILAAAFTKVAPYIAEMGNLTSILEVVTIITILGAVGYALSQFAGIVGKIKVSTVAKGLANMAIMLGGMSALFLVVGALTFLNFDYMKMLKIVGILGVLGLVGSACAVFAGIVGMIPIPTVLAGLVNIALVLGGLTAVVVAFGALSKIEGFNEFISTGGDTLANLFNVLGKIVGSAIGGLGEGLTNSLPKIGKNLAAFATSLKPMFTMFSGADMSGIGNFFKALGAFLLQIAAEKIVSFFGGETNFATLGQQLNTFATNSQGFFKTVATFPEEGFTKAKMLFDCLAGLKSLPKDGGVVGWFSGEINYTNIANGLKQLSSESVTGFFTAVAGLNQAGFDNATKLFDCLAGLKSLPKDGGVVGWFCGDVNYENIAAGLAALSGEGVQKFFTMAAGINPAAFENIPKMFESLASISELPKEGGWWDKLTGTETSTIGNLATELSNFATNTKGFFDLINTAKTENLTALAEGITTISESIANMQTVVTTSATAILSAFTGMLDSMVLAIDSVDLTDEGSQMINGLIRGINNKKSAAVAAARSVANAINAEYQKIQDIHSPSRVWEKFGAYQIQGDINGMEDNLPRLQSTAQQAGEMSIPKYTPESSGTTNRTSYNTFSPSFTLNMNGASATDGNKRKVQRWVKEAIEETFNSMSRTSPSLIEV